MIDESLLNQLKQLIDSSRTCFIAFPPTASADQKAVAVSLYLALSRAQKSVVLVSPQDPPTGDAEVLTGLYQVQHELGNQNLSISFPYSPDQVDKVSYHIGEETKRFFLSIKPKPGVPPLDASQVEFSYTGATADVVFLVGVKELESLEQLYFGYEQLYQEVPTVSLNNYSTSFGTHKVDAGASSSLSEVVAQAVPQLGFSLDSDIATNLLYGIESSTKNLSSPTTSAETFETVALLLRAGARRSFKRSSGEERDGLQANESVLHEGAGVVAVPTDEAAKRKIPKAKAIKAENKKDSLKPPADYVPKRLM